MSENEMPSLQQYVMLQALSLGITIEIVQLKYPVFISQILQMEKSVLVFSISSVLVKKNHHGLYHYYI